MCFCRKWLQYLPRQFFLLLKIYRDRKERSFCANFKVLWVRCKNCVSHWQILNTALISYIWNTINILYFLLFSSHSSVPCSSDQCFLRLLRWPLSQWKVRKCWPVTVRTTRSDSGLNGQREERWTYLNACVFLCFCVNPFFSNITSLYKCCTGKVFSFSYMCKNLIF